MLKDEKGKKWLRKRRKKTKQTRTTHPEPGQILKTHNPWNLGSRSNQEVYYEPILKYQF